jgi:predicted NBD/HSP70 family sugar kinase
VLARASSAIGALCVSLVNILNPDIIVIGGSIAEHRPRLLDVARDEIVRHAFGVPASRVRVVPPELGEDVSLVGTLPIVIERMADPAYRAGSQRPTMVATAEQGALRP